MRQPDKIKFRISFTKLDKCRFLGHLDLQSLFQRAISRAKLPIAYSAGFNPHQLLSFAQPLSLGYGGLREFLDTEMTEPIDGDTIKSRLNQVLPKGIEILDAAQMPPQSKSSASMVEKAIYQIHFPDINISNNNFIDALNKIMEQNQILIYKKNKKTPEDIRPDIFALALVNNADKTYIRAIVAAGSQRNLRPDSLAKLILENLDCHLPDEEINYVREAILLAG